MTGTDAVGELRQIVHEALNETIQITNNPWVGNVARGWQANIWASDITIRPEVEVFGGQTLLPQFTLTLVNITTRFELFNRNLKVFIDAPQFTASHSENLAEPNSMLKTARWLDDAIRFAIRDIPFPASV